MLILRAFGDISADVKQVYMVRLDQTIAKTRVIDTQASRIDTFEQCHSIGDTPTLSGFSEWLLYRVIGLAYGNGWAVPATDES